MRNSHLTIISGPSTCQVTGNFRAPTAWPSVHPPGSGLNLGGVTGPDDAQLHSLPTAQGLGSLFGDQGLADLSNAQWLTRMLGVGIEGLEPNDVERPWVWVAPGDGGQAMVGWGEQQRFTATGPEPMTHAWYDYAEWSRAHGSVMPAFGSFPFDRDSQGFLVAPKALIMRPHPGAATSAYQASGITFTRSRTAHAPHPDDQLPELSLEFVVDDSAPAHWAQIVDATKAALTDPARAMDPSRAMDKVVLARSVHAAADRPMSQSRVLQALATRFEDCWIYAADGLVGATPELLAEASEGIFHCRILAGTRKPQWDAELMTDPKERREHELSVTSVTEHLAGAGLTQAEITGPFLLQLPNVTHLATDIRARIAPGHGSADIADLLYPTAAICGVPRELAFEQIRRIEDLDRGRFSGPVGWITADGSGQWGLALRCAQFTPGSQQAELFAGAGILPDSQAEREWLETDAKMEPMRRALLAG